MPAPSLRSQVRAVARAEAVASPTPAPRSTASVASAPVKLLAKAFIKTDLPQLTLPPL